MYPTTLGNSTIFRLTLYTFHVTLIQIRKNEKYKIQVLQG